MDFELIFICACSGRTCFKLDLRLVSMVPVMLFESLMPLNRATVFLNVLEVSCTFIDLLATF